MMNARYVFVCIGSLSLLAAVVVRGQGGRGADEVRAAPAGAGPARVGPAKTGDAEEAAAATRPAARASTRPLTGPSARDPSLPPEMDVPEIPVPPSPALSPREELQTLKVAPGFKVELVASEPLIEDPIAIHFDGDGRLWVCEMRAYMPHLDPGDEELKPLGRISYLEDTNGDGKFDKKTVFLDGLILPRACTPYRDGVLVAAPPYAWFCRDTNGDGVCDERQLLAADYDNHSNPEHQPNGLMPGLDNWVHNSQWGWRFRYVGEAGVTAAATQPKTQPSTTGSKQPIDPHWVRAADASHGQWGITQDDFGRVYTNGNTDLLRCDYLPAYLLSRNPHYTTLAGINQKVYSEQFTYPIRPTPGVNRGYQPGALDKEGRLRIVTAACAPHIYRGDGLGNDPEGRPLYGNAFICEPAGNLVKREILTETDGLIVKGKDAYDKAEFLASTDERFRPVFLADGPEGALYVCDLYRGVLQHQKYVTPYLRKQIKSRDLEQGVHFGRIYRIVPDSPAAAQAMKAPRPKMLKAPAAALVQYLSQPAGWWRDMAQQQIVARNDPSVGPALAKLATTGPTWQSRLHALYTLEGLHKLDEATVKAAFADADSHVRVAALRLAEPFVADPRSPLVPAVTRTAKDEHPDVRLAFLFTASTITTPEAEKLVAATYVADGDRPFVKDAVLSGLGGRELEFLQQLLADAEWAKDGPAKAALVGGLASCVMHEAKPARVQQVLTLADAQTGETAWRQAALIAGLTTPNPRAPNRSPVKLDAEPPILAKLEKSEDTKTRATAKTLAKLFVWPGKPIERTAQARPLTKEEQASFERGKAVFLSTCAACHQQDGMGEVGKAPSFRNSPLLLGPEGRTIRIVLHGLRGQVTINGETAELEMPTLSSLSDEQIADALTYVRREWEHAADPVTAESVARVRAQTKDRGQPWTREEIQALRVPGAPAPASGAARAGTGGNRPARRRTGANAGSAAPATRPATQPAVSAAP